MENQERSRRFGRLRKYFVLICKSFFLLALVYPLILLIGLIPINGDFQPSPEGVLLYLRSNAIHADLVMPVSNEVMDWRTEFSDACFSGDVSDATHVAIGWGDQGFFIETPTWDDLKWSTAINALVIPSKTCMHVVMKNETEFANDYRSIKISVAEYQSLVRYVQRSFRRNGTGLQIIEDAAYRGDDAFFEAVGSYHALNTCNSWVGGGLKTAGVKTPWLTPLPESPFLYLPQ